MIIDILALDGVFDTGLAAMQDTFAIAVELGKAQRGLSAPLLSRVVSVRRGVTTANGLKVPTQRASALSRPDVIVVSGDRGKDPPNASRCARPPRCYQSGDAAAPMADRGRNGGRRLHGHLRSRRKRIA